MEPQYFFPRSPGNDDMSFLTRPQTSVTAGICRQQLPVLCSESGHGRHKRTQGAGSVAMRRCCLVPAEGPGDVSSGAEGLCRH